MRTFKLAAVASTALVGSLLAATGAFAQSTGTNEVEEVVITTTRGLPTIDGVITAETAPKAKASIDQEFISTQATGQTIIQSLNLTPGLNFTNNDPYGSSGGNLRIRGFDGNRISLTFDGVPLNDTGNYAIYTNQQLDPELISRASVNMGTTDVDSPTASAVGGTINYVSLKPSTEMGGRVVGAIGEFNYGRIFGLFESGEIGPIGTTSYAAASYQKYDKFKGPGDLEKWQINGKIYQPIGDNGDFVSIAAHYNENRNDFYRNATITQFKANGRDFDNNPTYLAPTTTADADPTTVGNQPGTVDPSANSDYYGLRINPSNTGNIRVQSKFTLVPDTLTLTVDGAYQYTLANGGGSTVVPESTRIGGLSAAALVLARQANGTNNPVTGFDLNNDGDTLDQIRFHSASNTNTNRYTTSASLIWNINDNNTLRLAYTGDYGDHRQTGEYGYISPKGEPRNVFAGNQSRKVLNADGFFLRSRDRQSYAILNQLALEYRGSFIDDRLYVSLGLRAPFFKRELEQNCFTQRNSSTVRCTSENPTAVVGSPTLVTFTGATTQFIRPFKADVKYDDILPNVGVSFEFLEGHTVFASYAEGLSAPRTDQLYTAGVNATTNRVFLSDVEPETSQAWDIGYRFRSPSFIASASIWSNNFQNRIVTSFDPDLGFSVDRNVGSVELWGFDGQAGWTPNEKFALYVSMSYTNSELQDNLLLSTTTELPTKGKDLVETPEWQVGLRAQYNITESLSVAVQTKWVDSRFTTDVNDEKTPGYNVTDLDLRYDLPWFNDKGAYLQLNVTNLFDEEYYSNISSATNSFNVDVDPGPGVVIRTPGFANVSIGAPRTVQATFSVRF
jgi:iron complex outermembrane receptor protein